MAGPPPFEVYKSPTPGQHSCLSSLLGRKTCGAAGLLASPGDRPWLDVFSPALLDPLCSVSNKAVICWRSLSCVRLCPCDVPFSNPLHRGLLKFSGILSLCSSLLSLLSCQFSYLGPPPWEFLFIWVFLLHYTLGTPSGPWRGL